LKTDEEGRAASVLFEGLSHTHRKEFCRWIAEAKKEETRWRRSEKAIEMLRNGVRTPVVEQLTRMPGRLCL
jgi:uncharacterized protein YdeI (YjbR/CyaY-like superfamily)